MTDTLRAYRLSDNLAADSGAVFLTGTQALVRLLLAQKKLDERAGLKTAGFVSGYRGSPLGMVDQQLWKAKKFLAAAHVEFLPAINETWPPRPAWAFSAWRWTRSAPSMACLRCGTARARAWTARATR